MNDADDGDNENEVEVTSNHRRRRAGAFFGRRKAKSLKPSQAKLMNEFLPRLKLNLNKPAPLEIGSLFDNEAQKIILEIGFGGGEHLVQRALEQPRCGFLGCEPFINGMAMALSAISENHLGNIRLFDEDATRLLDWLPSNSIHQIYLLYPDPWPKKRHWKRRFVNRKNLQRFARVLETGGEFRFASDIVHYVNWTLNLCDESDTFARLADDAADQNNAWPGWKSTRYETKAIRQGRAPAYLTFTKRS